MTSLNRLWRVLFRNAATERGSGTGAEVAGINQGKPLRLHTLDSVRGIAAMVVVIHHCLLTQPAFSDFFFSTWQTPAATPIQFMLFHTPARILWDGFEAVTLFYVLSGVVLALPWVEGRPPRYFPYCIKRICRIYLPYLVIVVISATLNMLFNPIAPVPGGSKWLNSMTWSNPVTMESLVDHVLMIGHHNTINGAVHSLIWEMRVSLVFPLMMLPIMLWRTRGALVLAVGLLALIAAIQLAFAPPGSNLLLLQPGSKLSTVGKFALEVQWTAYYAQFFVLGSVLAINLGPVRRMLTRTVLRGGWFFLLAGLLVIQAHWTELNAVQGIMVALGSALVIVAALAAGRIEAVLSHRLLRFLGRISYSVYLVHVPLLLSTVLLLQGRVPIVLLLIALPPLAVLVGWMFHEAVAEPSVRLGQGLTAWLSRSASAPVPLVTAVRQ